jgi:hypothetical protein
MDLRSQHAAILTKLASERSKAGRAYGELSSRAAVTVCSG